MAKLTRTPLSSISALHTEPSSENNSGVPVVRTCDLTSVATSNNNNNNNNNKLIMLDKKLQEGGGGGELENVTSVDHKQGVSC